MYKRELRKLRTLNATREMMAKAKKYEKVEKTEIKTSWRPYEYETQREYGLYIRLQSLKGIIKVALFEPLKMIKGQETPTYEIFLNTKGEEYITRELDDEGKEKRWATGKIDSLPGIEIYKYCGYGYSLRTSRKGTYCNPEGTKTLRAALDQKEGSASDMILAWQIKCREKQIAKQEARQVAPWDADMKLVKPLGKRVEEWASKEVVEDQFIIYSRNTDKTAYCSHCRKEVPLKEKPAHLKEGQCPCCKANIKYICSGRRDRQTTDWHSFEMIDRYPGGFIVRYIQIRNNMSFLNPKKSGYTVYEYERIIYEVDNEKNTWRKAKEYNYEFWKQKVHRWVRQDTKTAPVTRSAYYRSYYYDRPERPFSYFRDHKIYKGNLNQMSRYLPKRSAVEKMIRLSEKMNVSKYLRAEEGNPAVEMLVKLDMIKLASELITAAYNNQLLNEDQTEIAKILKIDNARLKRLKNIDGGLTALKWYQEEKKKNRILPDGTIRYFSEMGEEPRDFDFISDRMSFVQIANYIEKQEKVILDTPKQVVTTWVDYLNMAKKLKRDLTLEQNFKPTNLAAAHANCIEIIEKGGMEKTAKEIKKKFPKVDKILPELTKYELAGKNYSILAPKNVFDIVREGTILQHCVHTCDYYFDRISRKESYLLFLRKSNSADTPWYTLEVEPGGNIRQKRTTGDNQNEDFKEALGFLKTWQKEIQKRLSKEDKLLAKTADEARKKNYAQLRKDDKRVWHGKLQGQLLADVLEKDFMAAV